MAKKPALSPEDARAEALNTALSTIERKYGKGAVMKLSDDAHVNISVIPPAGALRKFSAPNLRVKRRLPCISLPNARKWAARAPLWTPNTRWT